MAAQKRENSKLFAFKSIKMNKNTMKLLPAIRLAHRFLILKLIKQNFLNNAERAKI